MKIFAASSVETAGWTWGPPHWTLHRPRMLQRCPALPDLGQHSDGRGVRAVIAALGPFVPLPAARIQSAVVRSAAQEMVAGLKLHRMSPGHPPRSRPLPLPCIRFAASLVAISNDTTSPTGRVPWSSELLAHLLAVPLSNGLPFSGEALVDGR